ncbi:MAG: hypothetical protein MJ193_05580, partial [Clostridia bacterium]|nr:hypothetical protein [Clostridia bacterium]
TIVGKITMNNKYRDLEFFASNVVIGDGEIYVYDPTDTEKEGFQQFLHSVFSTDVMAMLDFNGLATDNAVEIQVGFESPGEYSMLADLTMNLLDYNANDFVDLMDRANAGDFDAYRLEIYDKAQDCDDFVRNQEMYEWLKDQDMQEWREKEEGRNVED